MKGFYFKIVVFLLPVFLVWGGVELFYRSVETNYSFKQKQLLKNYNDAEVLVFGSSHALFGINPSFFEKKTFNISNISQSLYFDELIFNKNIDQLPKLEAVIFTISYFSLSQEDNTSEDAWRKYFYDQQMKLDVPIVSPLDYKKYSLALVRRFDKSVELMCEYAKNGTVVSCLENGYGKQDAADIVPDKEAIAEIIAKKHEDNLSDFTTNINRLQRIIDACKKRGIQVFLVEMPVYETYYNSLNTEKKEKIITTCSALEKENPNTHYIKLSQDSRFVASDLRDADHLTNDGAKKCSELLNSLITAKTN